MKITKYIEFAREMEIDICAADIRDHIFHVGDYDTAREIREALNNCAAVFNGVSDKRISEMSEEVRRGISRFLADQAKRFAVEEGK